MLNTGTNVNSVDIPLNHRPIQTMFMFCFAIMLASSTFQQEPFPGMECSDVVDHFKVGTKPGSPALTERNASRYNPNDGSLAY